MVFTKLTLFWYIMIFSHVIAQWSEKACFFMSKQALTLQFILSKNSIEQPYSNKF